MTKPKTIDLTPTWMGLYPLFEQWILSGTKEQKQVVLEEIKTLFQKVDAQNATNHTKIK